MVLCQLLTLLNYTLFLSSHTLKEVSATWSCQTSGTWPFMKQDARYWMLGAGALGRPRGMVWGGRREEGSGWGTHVYLWRIHFDIWQKQYNIVKFKNKIKLKKKRSAIVPQWFCSPKNDLQLVVTKEGATHPCPRLFNIRPGFITVTIDSCSQDFSLWMRTSVCMRLCVCVYVCSVLEMLHFSSSLN